MFLSVFLQFLSLNGTADLAQTGYKAFFSCSTKLSMKFQLLIKTKILKNKDSDLGPLQYRPPKVHTVKPV